MICDNCKIERKESDFLNNQKYCYKCEYLKKTTKEKKKRVEKQLACRICNKNIFHQDNRKNYRRKVFCSPACAEIGNKESRDNHWTRKVRKNGVTHDFKVNF